MTQKRLRFSTTAATRRFSTDDSIKICIHSHQRQRPTIHRPPILSRLVAVAMATSTAWVFLSSLAGRITLVRSFSHSKHLLGLSQRTISSSNFLKASSFCVRSSSNQQRSRRQGNQNHGHRNYGSSNLKMMPEGPEVRTLVDQLGGGIGKRLVDIRFLSGRYFGQRPVGFSEFAKTMTPLKQNEQPQEEEEESIDVILDWNCKGKFIYVILDDGKNNNRSILANDTDTDQKDEEENKNDNDFQRSIWITLGMTGRFVNEARHLEDPSYGRWVLQLSDKDLTDENNDKTFNIYYHDKRNFGTVKFCLSKSELDQKLNSLGPDVLELARKTSILVNVDEDDNFDPSVTIDDELEAQKIYQQASDDFLQLLEKQRNPQINICKLLMDQKKISGVGNYMLSEALYRSDIDPFCGIDELSNEQRRKLFSEVQAVALESYRSQQESTPDEVTDGYTSVRELAPFEFQLRVYGNTGTCPKGTPVIRETNGPHGRTIWYTKDQLFVPRQAREQNEPKEYSSPSQRSKDDPWTITRRDGVEVYETDNRNGRNKDLNQMEPVSTASPDWNLLDGLTDPGWKRALEPYVTSSQSFADLQLFLKEEYDTQGVDQIYPPPHQIFSALNLCPLDKVKVVVLGQDPYHGPNQSTGLAFSVSKKIARIPPSLRNILKELDDDVGRTLDRPMPDIFHGDLEGWARQGILMLNTVLTVRRGQANSHQRKGWEDFTDEIVRILRDRSSSDNNNQAQKPMVFLLWGGPASKKAKSIVESEMNHAIIATSHPSPLGATKTASPFLTSRCFSRANAALIEMGETPIDWYDR